MVIRDKATGKFLKGSEPPQKGKGKPLFGNSICPVCGKVFYWERASYNKPPKTCSKECRYKSASITGTRHIYKDCVICGKSFGLPPSVVNDHGKKNSRMYCSKECRWKTRMRWTENEKQNAQRLVRTLVNQGVIIPEKCRDCNEAKVEGHHHKGYDRKNWLTVIWLCRKHHVREHERLRRTGESLLL